MLNTGQTLCLIRKDAPGDVDDETDHETIRQMHMPATARTREEWELYIKNGHAAAGLHHHVPHCHLDKSYQELGTKETVPEMEPYEGGSHIVVMVVKVMEIY